VNEGQQKMRKIANLLRRNESGMAAIEYAVLLALLAGAVAVAASGLGTAVFTRLGSACRSLGGPC